eukprot:TRINITY_DN16955_c0_g1_i1.p1 TRINITY_DN16955_c0_g1~~TRINITY_DN16955_c0_g1_i1.p1  ORF type:complete len:290 (+),score=72.51 TRINITY_DN16955_c0_g1_i1:65-871(+)
MLADVAAALLSWGTGAQQRAFDEPDGGEGSHRGVSWRPAITFGGWYGLPSLRFVRTGQPLPGGNLPSGTLLLSNLPRGIFKDAVIVIAKHGTRAGAYGFILNKDLAGSGAAELTQQFPLDLEQRPNETADSLPFVFGFGGPLLDERADRNNGAWTLAHPHRQVPGAKQLTQGLLVGGSAEAVRVSTERTLLEQPQASVRPRALLGYSAWAPGQLDGELRAGDWSSCRSGLYDPAIFFSGAKTDEILPLLRRQCSRRDYDATGPPASAA